MSGTFDKNDIDKIKRKRKEWENGTLKKQLDRFNITESENEFFTPADIEDFNFMEKVGFPGEYPFTAGVYPCQVPGSGPVSSIYRSIRFVPVGPVFIKLPVRLKKL